MTEFVERMSIAVKEQAEIIASKQKNETGRYLTQAHKDQDEIMNAYRRIENLFGQLQWDATLSVWNTVDEQLSNTRIEALSPSKLAAYNSMLAVEVKRRACAKNTRVELLRRINDWSQDPDAPNICWMSGMAGTGKTTIAYTFSESLKALKTLGASFFCSRTSGECRDVGRIIPTIAYQLARYSRPFQVALTRILGSDPDIGTQTITHQFERLIKEPLASVKDAMPTGLVVVIDALDECSNTEGVGMILNVLFRKATSLPLKFFVTSRPEQSVHSRVSAQPDKTRRLFVLHEIERSLVRADIEAYLREELPSDKVSDTQLKRLAELAGNLFIYAATAIRYIRRAGGSIDQKRLGIVLSPAKASGHQCAEVDRLYTSILAETTENSDLDVDEKKQVQVVLWTVVCVREPVTIKTLAELIGSGPGDVETALSSLLSVLHVSETAGTVSTLHASFPDYIFDQTRSERFHCIESEMNQILAEHCFDIMDRQLRFNLCGLESSFKYDHEVEGLTDRVSEVISPTLSYAIAQWGDHLVRSPVVKLLQTMLHRFLSTGLLFWMEALNLKGILSVGINTLLKLKPWLKLVSSAPDLVKLLDDCWLFLTRFAASPIAESTPHIYTSALPFCQHTNSVYKNYWPRTRQLLTLHGSVIEQSQTAQLATWNMHSYPLSLAFSSDASRFAVGFRDGTVSILDAHTGIPVLGPFKEHSDYVRSVALSPDGSLLASCSDDGTVIIRDAYTGTRICDSLQGHEHHVMSVCFSPDGHSLLSGSADRTSRIWDSRTGKAVPNSVKHHPHPVNCTAYSSDGQHIACGLGSDECPMIVYSASTGEPISGSFDECHSSVSSVAFSSDGKSVVTGHASGDICIWSVQDGVLTHGPLKAHKGSIRLVRSSPTGNRLVTASDDRSVYVWDAHNHYAQPCLLGTHQSWVYSAVFSPDGTRILSCSSDHTIKVWNTLHSISSDNAPRKTPTMAVYSVTFSPDGLRIAAASEDHAIYIFNADDATPALDPLVAHTDPILSVTFSADGRSVGFSPDGRLVASGFTDGTICVFDSHTGHLVLGPLKCHTSLVRSVVFSPNGTYILSGSYDGTVRVWRAKDGVPVCKPLMGHKGGVMSVGYSPDGASICSGSDDSTVRVWKAPRGCDKFHPFKSTAATLGERKPHGEILSGLKISDDGWAENGDSQRLFWVPPDVVKYFPSLETVYTVGKEGTMRADYSAPLFLGNEWHRCYEG
ncbi:Vegetative incompatibility protein HET-E-1 OS=Podospora anserina GN=HET-E1 PE=4 SV=1 [Rhizoctonia solani AG-1 IB]|uniref:Vegetative incompatibility protein HET-E-1 n=1 Tax=Thanatephorus cucumeris (strain AG1-IB / isolate 7/3/14) TaxID=1108050 RepID=A0A0B7FWM9_THACB|nr:Vegetative incompatibility protein HET-E-1 OS=Podospora anserina GN=HET-E1 PE=4 SV=1 [Rhizoctonia solani AG-1 IB]